MEIGTEPIQYQVLADDIARQINTGRLKPGERLCSMRAMAQRHGLSVAVVRKSFSALEESGVLIQRHGSGTFVNPDLKTKGTKMLALLTMFQDKTFENYFEPLFSEAANSNIIPIVGTIESDGDWKGAIKKISAREPDAFLIDVEARVFKLDELRKACAPFPCCFVNRWEWHGVKPERAVLNDYAAAYRKALCHLKQLGHSRVLAIGHHEKPLPYLQERLKKASISVDMEFGRELSYVGIEDIEGNPALLKKIFAKNGPTAVFGLSDFIVHQFLQYGQKSSLDTSGLDKVGLFNQSYSNIPGREFSSVRFDLERIWKRAFNHCNAGDESFVEYVEPELIVRGN
ncbi:MAG: GntR family transcriptional regulator [Victivallales bacterium]